MEIYQLEYFLALAKFCHFGKASDSVSISLSAFSSGIKNLEKELGISLFVRGQKATVLSPAGEKFLPLAMRIIEAVRVANEEIQKYVKETQDTIRLGTLLANDYSATFPIIIAFQKTYPNIRLELYVDTTLNLEKSLLNGSLNAAFLSFDKQPNSDKLDFLPLWETPLALLVSKANPLSEHDVVSLESVCSQKLLIEREHRQLIEDLCTKAGLRPQFELVSNSVPLINTAVKDDAGCAIVAKTVGKKMESASTKVVDFLPTVHRKIFLSTSKNAPFSSAISTFTDFCRSTLCERSHSEGEC